MMRMKWNLVSAIAIVSIAATPVLAGPLDKEDMSWLTLTGTIESTSFEGFTLSYDSGSVLVELDDWDSFDEAEGLPTGAKVTVYGRLDADLVSAKSIEAGSVFIHDTGTFVYASSYDEERTQDPWYVYSYPILSDGSWVSMSGHVIETEGDELVMDTGVAEIVVDTDEMSYDPLDEKGLQHVEVGDHISVWGTLDYDLFEAREIKAKTILTHSDMSIDADATG